MWSGKGWVVADPSAEMGIAGREVVREGVEARQQRRKVAETVEVKTVRGDWGVDRPVCQESAVLRC